MYPKKRERDRIRERETGFEEGYRRVREGSRQSAAASEYYRESESEREEERERGGDGQKGARGINHEIKRDRTGGERKR